MCWWGLCARYAHCVPKGGCDVRHVLYLILYILHGIAELLASVWRWAKGER